MSSAFEQPKKYADFDEYIDFQLQKTREGIRLTDIFTALSGVAVLSVSYMLLFVILDHWVIPGGFGYGMRVTLLGVLLCSVAGWIAWKVALPYFKRVNTLFAARAIEQAAPGLDSNLLSYVDLARSGRDVSSPILSAIEKRAAVTLSKSELEVDEAVDRRQLLLLLYALLAVVLLFCLYTVFSPKKVWPSVWRAFAPASEVQVATQTEFLAIEPGDTSVPARSILEVKVDLRGEIPEDVTLYFSTTDRRFVEQPVRMQQSEEGLKSFVCRLAGENNEGLLQTLDYWIEAGDAQSRSYRVSVEQPPSATIDRIDYDEPDYTERAPESRMSPVISMLEGTEMALSATASMAINKARIEFSATEQFPAKSEEHPVEIKGGTGTELSFHWQPLRPDVGEQRSFYRIRCWTESGVTDANPAVYPIEIVADQKPEVSVMQPDSDRRVPSNAVIPFLIRARDPDYRLSKAVLKLEKNGLPLGDRELYSGSDTSTSITYELALSELFVKPGDELTWWVEVRDNRFVERAGRIVREGNVTSSTRLKLVVEDEVSQQEADEQLEADREQIKEEQKQADPETNDPAENDPEADSGEHPDQDSKADAEAGKKPSEEQNEAGNGKSSNAESGEKPADGTQSESGETQSGAGKSGSDDGQKSGAGTSEQKDNKTGRTESGETSEDGSKSEDGSEEGSAESKPARKPGGSKESGSEQSFDRDGSQDDEVLEELLKKAN